MQAVQALSHSVHFFVKASPNVPLGQLVVHDPLLKNKSVLQVKHELANPS